jgi:hypothetical protein
MGSRPTRSSSPWSSASFRRDLGKIGCSTREASRQHARDALVLARLAGRLPADDPDAMAWKSLCREIALARRVSDQAAQRELRAAQRLTGPLRETLGLLKSGELTVQRARVFLGELEPFDDDLAGLVQARLLEQLPRLSPGRIEQAVRREVLAIDADAAALRAAAARAGRRVTFYAEPDEQGCVTIHGPAVAVRRWYATLDRRARALRAAGDARTLDQLRADLALSGFPCNSHPPADTTGEPTAEPTTEPTTEPAAAADAAEADEEADEETVAAETAEDGVAGELLGAGLRAAGVEAASADCRLSRPVQANVTVPVETALGLSNDPAWLDGYGWINAPAARTLLLDAELRRICTQTGTGAIVDLADRDLRPTPTPDGLREVLLGLLTDNPRAFTGEVGEAAVIEMSEIAWRNEPQHDPSPGLREFVALRDRTCDGPTGTSTPANTAELDHDRPWPTGPTAAWNLAARSTRTHQLKHYGWIPVRTPDGTVWFSPAGQIALTPNQLHPPPELDEHAVLPDPTELAAIDADLVTPPGPDDVEPWAAFLRVRQRDDEPDEDGPEDDEPPPF